MNSGKYQRPHDRLTIVLAYVGIFALCVAVGCAVAALIIWIIA